MTSEALVEDGACKPRLLDRFLLDLRVRATRNEVRASVRARPQRTGEDQMRARLFGLEPLAALPILLLLLPPAEVRARQYQFTFEGYATVDGQSQFSIGDPFTLRYIADDHDTTTDPSQGFYTATNAV